MPRLMSVSLTEQSVVERRKTVTRRTGWRFLKPGDRLTLCRKVMGRAGNCPDCDGTGMVTGSDFPSFSWTSSPCVPCEGTGTEPLVRLAEVEVVDVNREPLWHITDADVEREGFAGQTSGWFIDFFCEHMGGTPEQEVTRIEWRYLDPEQAVQA